jgi:hypothetical protein
LLAKLSKFENLLFLDSDTLPILNDFIQNYISQITNREIVVFGGIKYQTDRPSKNQLLRWVYGNKREVMSIEKRIENPYLCFLTSNFMIKKSIFDKVKFDETIKKFGHEDTLFSFDLKHKDIKIIHTENAVYHLGLETSCIFIKKSEESVFGLKHLIDTKKIDTSYTKISRFYKKLEKFKLTRFIGYTFNLTKPLLTKQLLSAAPSLLIFDLYRLGYLCSLKK